jgi:transposase-like protein
MEAPETLQKAIAYFSDPQRSFDAAVDFRWPGGNVTCPRCGEAKHSFIKTRRIWFCYTCKKQFTIKVGTIMEDSPIGLDKWMIAMWMLANCKNGISSYELAKVLGIRQNSAWFMLHRIREAMKGNPDFKLGEDEGGPVEVDETFVGGKIKNMHRKHIREKYHGQPTGGATTKTIVMGMIDRNSRQVRTKVIPNVKRDTLQNEILANVSKSSKVYTDNAIGYYELAKQEFVHETVNHLQEYVRGQVHTNSIENFWSLLKRTLNGTYVAVEPFHLDRYADEQAFRFNNRATKDNKLTDSDRFALLMSQVGGKRLTYSELTGKDTDSLHRETAGTGQEEPF